MPQGIPALASPPCEVNHSHPPATLAVSAFPPRSDKLITLRVCRLCARYVVKAMSRNKYIGVTVTAPEQLTVTSLN
jgi:hypothetical protein